MTTVVVAQRMWQRRDTAANWTSVNPVMQAGEIGIELSPTAGVSHKVKIGDGVSTWTQLPYFADSASAMAAHLAAADPHPQYQLESSINTVIDAQINARRNQPNGIAGLDASATHDGGNF